MIENSLWKILAFIVAIILMFAAPMMTMYDRQDAITYSVVFSAVGEMADLTRELGVLNDANYVAMMDLLSATGNTYTVELEHYKKVYMPVYDGAGVFQNDYETIYQGAFNADIMTALQGSGTYKMAAGDLFFVHVENKSKTKSQIIREILFDQGDNFPTIIVRSGGMIHHEPY